MRRNPDERLRDLERQAQLGDRDAALQLVMLLGRTTGFPKEEFPVYLTDYLVPSFANHTNRELFVNIQPRNNNQIFINLPGYRETPGYPPGYSWSKVVIDHLSAGPVKYLAQRWILDRRPIPRLTDPYQEKIWVPVYEVPDSPILYQLSFNIESSYPSDAPLYQTIEYVNELMGLWIPLHQTEIEFANKIDKQNQASEAYAKYLRKLTQLSAYERDLINNVLEWLAE